MVDRGSIIKLDNDKSYCVAEIINYNNKKYLYLVNIDNKEELKYCEYLKDSNQLLLVEDQTLIIELSKRIMLNIV